jgi:4-amino-4-deoxy-L-arabinose transferase-like glycosyltransferase
MVKLLLLILVMLLGLSLLTIFYSHITYTAGIDDATYLSFAKQIASHSFNPLSNPYGYGWLFPYFVYLSGFFFGNSTIGYQAGTAIEYLSLIVLTFILGNRISKNRYIPILSAFIVCIAPFTVAYSTRILNDTLLAVFATLSLIFLFSNKKHDWFMSGLLAGLMLSVKLLAFPYILAFFVICMLEGKYYAVIGILIGIFVYVLPFGVLSGNPLYSIQNYGSFQSSISPASLGGNIGIMFVMLGLVQLHYVGNPIYYQIVSMGLLLWFVIFSSYLLIVYRGRHYIYLAIIFWFVVLYLHFGTQTLSHYSFISVIDRYYQLVIAPMALLIAYFFSWAYWWLDKRLDILLLSEALVILLFILLIISLIPSYEVMWKFNQ